MWCAKHTHRALQKVDSQLRQCASAGTAFSATQLITIIILGAGDDCVCAATFLSVERDTQASEIRIAHQASQLSHRGTWAGATNVACGRLNMFSAEPPQQRLAH